MDCRSIAELLPWLLNGTLAPAEREQAMQHLAGCAGCRAELGDTASAWEIFAQHVSPEMLMDHVSGRALAPADKEMVAAHLKSCPACAEECGLLRESLASREEPAIRQSVEPRSWFRWQFAFSAAALMLGVTGAGWFRSARQVNSIQARLNDLAAGNRSLENRVQGLTLPGINVATLDVFPKGMALRSELSAADVVVPNATQAVTLILNSQSTTSHPSFEIEIVNERNAAVWNAKGLQRNPTGDYTLSLPAGFLAPGGYTISVYGGTGTERSLVESYSIRVKQ
jgi:hypothetical protein